MQDFQITDGGIQSIKEPGYKLEDLRKYIQNTCLAKRCEFLEHTHDIPEICKGFLALCDNSLNLDEITTLLVTASMVYFIDANMDNLEWRHYLLEQTFKLTDTLNPLHLHVAAKRMWNGLRMQGIDFVFNILAIRNNIALINETGRAIAILLMWALLGEITENEIEFYCFRKITDLLDMLNDIDDDLLQLEDSSQTIHVLVQVIGFLINAIVFAPHEIFAKAGYRPYFMYNLDDLQKLQNWAEQLCDNLKISVTDVTNYWDLRMVTSEYVNTNIIAMLQDKIIDMQ